MSFIKTHKWALLTGVVFFILGFMVSCTVSLYKALATLDAKVEELPQNEPTQMRRTGNIQSPISVVEFWEMSTTKSFCVVAVNTNRDQNVASKLYAAQVVMDCRR